MIEYLANYLAKVASDVRLDLDWGTDQPAWALRHCTLEITPKPPWTAGKGFGYEATFTYTTSGIVSGKGMGR